MGFFDGLSNEVILLVLEASDGVTLVRAHWVCRRWRTVMRAANVLYLRNLALEGVVEDDGVPRRTRQSELKTFVAFWTEGIIVGHRVIDLDVSNDVLDVDLGLRDKISACGPWILCWHIESRTVSHIARLKDHPRQWKQLGVVGHAFTIGLESMNLLIWVSPRCSGSGVDVQFLHAGTLERHQYARLEVLPWPMVDMQNVHQQCDNARLCGDIFGCNVVDGDVRYLFVWDWRNGLFLFRHRVSCASLGHALTPPMLLSDRAFGWLEVSTSFIGTQRVVFVVNYFDGKGVVFGARRWEFPPLAFHHGLTAQIEMENAAEVDVNLRLNHVPFVDSSPSADGRSSDKLIAIGLSARNDSVTFYTLRSTVLQPVDSRANVEVVLWDDWGPKRTRCLQGYFRSVRGCRALHYPDPCSDILALCFVPARRIAARSGIFASKSRDRFVGMPSRASFVAFKSPVVTWLSYFDSPFLTPHDEFFECHVSRLTTWDFEANELRICDLGPS